MLSAFPVYCRKPSWDAVFKEFRAPIDFLGGLGEFDILKNARQGDGRRIMLLPGYTVGSTYLKPLESYLNWKGYDAFEWGLGRNEGDYDGYATRIGRRLRDDYEIEGAKTTLIGHSLGGAIAREVARRNCDIVDRVITMGTPIVGGAKYTILAEKFAAARGIDIDDLEEEVHRRNCEGIQCPVTAIYSKEDGFIDWRAARDIYNPQAQNIEVTSSHMGMPLNASVWKVISEMLAPTEAKPNDPKFLN